MDLAWRDTRSSSSRTRAHCHHPSQRHHCHGSFANWPRIGCRPCRQTPTSSLALLLLPPPMSALCVHSVCTLASRSSQSLLDISAGCRTPPLRPWPRHTTPTPPVVEHCRRWMGEQRRWAHPRPWCNELCPTGWILHFCDSPGLNVHSRGYKDVLCAVMCVS